MRPGRADRVWGARCGRADLVRALGAAGKDEGPPEPARKRGLLSRIFGRKEAAKVATCDVGPSYLVDEVAARLGYVRIKRPIVKGAAAAPIQGEPSSDFEKGALAAEALLPSEKPGLSSPDSAREAARHVRFWRPVVASFTEPLGAEVPEVPPWEAPHRRRTGNVEPPPPAALASWPDVWRRLRPKLCVPAEGGEIDLERAVDQLCRGETLHDFPRRRWRALVDRLDVVVDRSSHLVPFWSDQDEVFRKLLRVLPSGGVTLHWWHSGVDPGGALAKRAGAAEHSTVLVLGDLGFLSSSSVRQDWLLLGRRLRALGTSLQSLVVGAARRPRASLADLWNAEPWVARERSAGPRPSEAELGHRATWLHRLLSLADGVEPGLLRDVRRMLVARAGPGEPDIELDSATEVDVWMHPAVWSRTLPALTVQPSALQHWRDELGKEDKRLLQEVFGIVVKWHGGLPEEVHSQECFFAGFAAEGVVSEQQAHAGRQLMGKTLRAIADEAQGRPVPRGPRAWFRRFVAGMPAGVPKDAEMGPLLERAWAAVEAGRDEEDVEKKPAREGPSRRWRVWQVAGHGLELWPAEADGESRISPADTAPYRRLVGSPLGEVVASRPEVRIAAVGQQADTWQLEESTQMRVLLPRAERFSLSTNRVTLTFEQVAKPEWATEIGRDEYGLYTVVKAPARGNAEGVRFRFRWVPPGRFLMGSPEGEAERVEDERQHEVELTAGYWLGETACTQELWVAVMGSNPSHFQTEMRCQEGTGRRPETRPVDNVSWKDCREFLRKLNHAVPGLEARLPTEAEWEYACRAGTTSPFSFGENITPELVNYDGNHPYDGAAKGVYREETVPAGSLPANAWGFHEMHGNILEWCEDRYGAYEHKPVRDPCGPREGSERVLRGGCWFFDARLVRSALRYARAPSYRSVYFGLRLARGQAQEEGEGKSRDAGGAERSEGRAREVAVGQPGGGVVGTEAR